MICLKLVYSIVYLKLCILIAYIHFLTRLRNDFSQVEDLSKLNLSTLNKILDLRGVRKSKLALEKNDLIQIVKSTGKLNYVN